jgi:hypothetical protein
MTLYGFAISVHVVSAIVGLGPVVGIAAIASSASGEVSASAWTAIGRLMKGMQIGLLLVLLSGIAMEALGGGHYHDSWWFRLSLLGLVVLGAMNGRIRRTVRRRAEIGEGPALATIGRSAWAMAGVTAIIAVLMEIKPW